MTAMPEQVHPWRGELDRDADTLAVTVSVLLDDYEAATRR
jgi:hypothetical protein